MRKEYSDLSDKQKIVYIKREAIVLVCTIVPVLVWFGFMMGFLMSFDPVVQQDVETQSNSTSTQLDKTEPNVGDRMLLGVGVIFFVGGWIGLIWFGSEIGTNISNRLKLYTDYQLEYTEKHLAEIKEALK